MTTPEPALERSTTTPRTMPELKVAIERTRERMSSAFHAIEGEIHALVEGDASIRATALRQREGGTLGIVIGGLSTFGQLNRLTRSTKPVSAARWAAIIGAMTGFVVVSRLRRGSKRQSLDMSRVLADGSDDWW